MDAESGNVRIRSPCTGHQLPSDACNHCVAVVHTTGELGGLWAMRTWPKTFEYEAERIARINQEQQVAARHV